MKEQEKGKAEGFTVAMALVDALPVLFFSAWMLLLAMRFLSRLFLLGAVLMALGGLCKVVWKLLLGLGKGDVKWVNLAFKPLMASGFLLVLASLIPHHNLIRPAAVWAAMTSYPSVLFFIAGALLLIGMCVFATRFDRSSARDNWRAQWINAAAQGAILAGILLL